MHFTGTVYRNPYWPTFPLIQITQGCTHNKCKFCTMYKDVPFRMQPMEYIIEDLEEIKSIMPNAKTIQLLSANPLAPTYKVLEPILKKINEYLPNIEYIYAATRVDDIKNKSVDELIKLKELGIKEISLGVESGDDWTLDRINKGYHASDILEQCQKLDEAGIKYWLTFLNGVAGKEHSISHAINTAKIFNQTHPLLVGTGGLTLFPGTLLLDEARNGKFTPLSEEEMIIELKTFVESLNVDCYFNTHHTSSINLSGPNFLSRKESIIKELDNLLKNGDLEALSRIRRNKRTL
ncbi:MAG: radical SAM protein [Bacilli bacterium]|nr:radical SAM protein [Bacilli bacterium]